MITSQFTPISIWQNGSDVSVDTLGVQVTSDNLVDTAVFCYSLFSNYNPAENYNAAVVVNYLTMTGQDYADWNNATDINQQALVWVAQQINLQLV